MIIIINGPITVAAKSKALNVLNLSNTGTVGSNPTQSMNICVYSVSVLDNSLATG
jgi:hypothetical protein